MELSIAQARRLALRSQGLSRKISTEVESSTEVNWRRLRATIKGMGALQIDAINTIIRSHYLPLYSRLGSYDRSILDSKVFDPVSQTAKRRTTFEYWGHECSIMPIEYYPLLRWRMQDAGSGVGLYSQLAEFAVSQRKYLNSVKAIVSERGPLTSRELGESGRKPGMWEWGRGKQALELLFWSGELSSKGRVGFQRVYDLTERVIPEEYLAPKRLNRIDAQKQLLLIAIRALGVGTASDLRDYFRLSAKDAGPALQALIDEGQVVRCNVQGWNQQSYVLPTTSVPRSSDLCALVSPFDPIIWHRERAKRLFGFDYKIEIYVPKAKRKYGYYVLPFLLHDRFVARVDLKADRVNGLLHVLGVWLEDDVDRERVIHELAGQLLDFTHWLNLASVKIVARDGVARELGREINSTRKSCLEV